ncbi:MAG TPA: sulfatase-like hydrolase/transferase [Chloroflexota bacterium]|jgi:arylsulfatase A-like enzyme
MPDRPNVVFILGDQQRWDTVGAYRCPVDPTPNLDAIARPGVRAAHAFTCQPVCA